MAARWNEEVAALLRKEGNAADRRVLMIVVDLVALEVALAAQETGISNELI